MTATTLAQKIEPAADILVSAIEADEKVESFYRQLMRIYQAQNRVEEAIEVYQRCRRALADEGPLASETEAIYQALT